MPKSTRYCAGVVGLGEVARLTVLTLEGLLLSSTICEPLILSEFLQAGFDASSAAGPIGVYRLLAADAPDPLCDLVIGMQR